jgi:hypothetical protein
MRLESARCARREGVKLRGKVGLVTLLTRKRQSKTMRHQSARQLSSKPSEAHLRRSATALWTTFTPAPGGVSGVGDRGDRLFRLFPGLNITWKGARAGQGVPGGAARDVRGERG